jgi:excisionase family DNA binding protein
MIVSSVTVYVNRRFYTVVEKKKPVAPAAPTQAADDTPSVVDAGFVAVAEAAEFLGLSRAKIYQLMDARELRFAKFGKSRRIPRAALLDFARRCLIGD